MALFPSNLCVQRRFMLRSFTSRTSSSGGSGGSDESQKGSKERRGSGGEEESAEAFQQIMEIRGGAGTTLYAFR